jgi:hypothetical protein
LGFNKTNTKRVVHSNVKFKADEYFVQYINFRTLEVSF